MAWYNPFSWNKKEPVEVEEKKPDPVKEGEFSTDLTAYRRMKSSQRNDWIIANMFQRTHEHIVTMNKKGEAVAMDSKDSSFAMDSDSIKSAFTLGQGVLPQVLFSWYVQQAFIGYQACSIIAQNAFVNKACTKPAKKALKKGYEITVNDGSEVDAKIIAAIRKTDKRFKIKKNLVEFERMNRIFGIRIAMFVVESDDVDYYLKPFNLDGIKPKSYKGIAQVDPYWVTPELDEDATADPASIHFYEPTWWRISGKRYHRSHLIITRYSEVTDILKPSYLYGGIPLPQLIYERIYSAERTANEAPMLALTKRVNIIKTDTKKALANQKAFEERMTAFNELRDNYGIFAIDKEEDYQQTDTALGDLDNIIMTQYQLVAALAGMPASELLETSPKGFNATGEFEKESWYDTLEDIQSDSYSPLLERHYDILIRSEGIEPFEFEITWKPLDSPTAKELAEINQFNSTTDTNLVTAGAIDATDVRDRIIADANSGYNGIQPFDDMDYEDEPEPEPDLDTETKPEKANENEEETTE